MTKAPVPLVYCSQRALRDAVRFLPRGACLEREVERAIATGRVLANRRKGKIVGENWTAHFERRPGRLRPRPRVWLVTSVEPISLGGGRIGSTTP